MRVVFVSYNNTGRVCLEKLIELGANVRAIVTSQSLSGYVDAFDFSDSEFSSKYRKYVHRTKSLNAWKTLNEIEAYQPDIIFVIGWSGLCGIEFLNIAEYTTIGMHPTLLPKHRGRAAIPWQIIHDVRRSGVTMFHIAEGADNGKIIDQDFYEIAQHDDAGAVHDKVKKCAVNLIERNYKAMEARALPARGQFENKASYFPKRDPADGIIDWNMSAFALDRWIRAQTRPYPGAFTWRGNKKMTIWKAHMCSIEREPGEIFSGTYIAVGTGCEHSIALDEVQFEGEEPLKGEQIFNSKRFIEGYYLG